MTKKSSNTNREIIPIEIFQSSFLIFATGFCPKWNNHTTVIPVHLNKPSTKRFAIISNMNSIYDLIF